ncbi:hypothetical protein IKN40_05620 [bacterium]|nr:hypothetical protein [bacterium]
MDNKKYLIIYHKEDNDGVFSSALFYDYLINTLNIDIKNIDLLPADYNILSDFSNKLSVEELHEKYTNIIMTDISFDNWKYIKAIWKEFKTDFTWCDHHAPIIKASFENHFSDIPGIRDIGRSAILCVWKYLYDQFDDDYNKKNVPELLRILSGYDSWTYEKEGYGFDYVRNINRAVTIKYDLNIDKVYSLVKSLREVYLTNKPSGSFSGQCKDMNLIKELHDYGKQLTEYDDIVNKNIIEKSGDKSWEVWIDSNDKDNPHPIIHKACAIFHQGQSNSTMFKSLQNKGINHGIVFKHQPDGNWVMNMYNINNDEWLHCGDFLKEKYHGGGHKGAAGCTLTEDQFIKILKAKKI